MNESAKSNRRLNGQFTRGQSGNPRGRPPRSARITHPEQFRDAVFSVAECEIETTLEGKPQRMTLLQANVMTLALKGAGGDTRASNLFHNVYHRAVEQELRDMREGIKRLTRGEPEFINEPDPVRRRALYEKFQYALDAVTGRRERLVPRLPRLKLKPKPQG
ncbi:MAG: DUF5681 domain-containing protein [Hyphomonadaceae bacterium]